MTSRFGAAVAIGVLLVVALSAVMPNEPPRVQATGSEPDAMIWHFNVFRMGHGLPPLNTDPTLMANAQTAAESNGAICATAIPVAKPGYQHKWSSWSHGGGATADARWPSWEIDSLYPSRILDPEFTSVGVGHAVADCQYGWMWSVALAEVDGAPAGPNPTPTGGTNPTPTPTTPTPTATMPAPTITATPVPTVVVTPTATPAATPSATPEPTATPYNPLNGDADCDGQVLLGDGMLILRLAADFIADAPCLGAHGVDCTGLIDELDVLALFKYLGDVPSDLPEGCTPIGTAAARPASLVLAGNY